MENSEDSEQFWVTVIDKLEEHDEFESHEIIAGTQNNIVDSDSEVGDFDESSDEDKPVSEVGFSIGESIHAGVTSQPLADWELAAAWQKLRHHELPEPSVAVRLILGVTLFYKDQPNVIRLPKPKERDRLVIVGDLHGHFGDLMHILHIYGEPQETHTSRCPQYLFNGDFVDRGSWGPEVLLSLYCLKLSAPQTVHLNRGNHEDIHQNARSRNGFRDVHCLRAWPSHSEAMYSLCHASFKQLPLCHTVGDTILVVHGGLPMDTGVSLAEIDSLDRRRDLPLRNCGLLGYLKGQCVKARRELIAGDGIRIPAGRRGQLVRPIGKVSMAQVLFSGCDQLVPVSIKGAPELEMDVEILYSSEEGRLRQRCDRLFVALLWSDPVPSDAASQAGGPNGRRGAGSNFDVGTTEEFLDSNGLQMLLRSHKKYMTGFFEEQRSRSGALLAATVFSASNYPGGAGEPHGGNKASVVVLDGSKDFSCASMTSGEAWHCPYFSTGPWKRPNIRPSVLKRARVSVSEIQRRMEVATCESDPGTETEEFNEQAPMVVTARSQALELLWSMIYAARPELLAHFQRWDREEAGVVGVDQWSQAMRAVLVPDDDFPWERVAKHLAHFDSTTNKCHYGAFLARYKNMLSCRLETRWCSKAMRKLFSKMGNATEVSSEWERLDSDGTGRLSYKELRPLFKANIECDAVIDDDRVYTMMAMLDSDHSGFVERDEYLRAAQSTQDGAENEFHNDEEDDSIERCWASLHGVLRALTAARCRADAAFAALDRSADGLLTRGEFREGLPRLIQGSVLLQSLEEWEPLLWTLVDADDSGCVSPQELAQAMAVYDAAGDGSKHDLHGSTEVRDRSRSAEPGWLCC
eukprot:TRINITY_DN36517_c0_g1_i1.p1 TRINITY_DN36517_c0_g1~~TRINITY_DN36517_c0_g1_i1.p1  ORF type:complete len:984 (-),score=162.89 TRINITY_DN36517_c0_g1_i1:108-2687(-)